MSVYRVVKTGVFISPGLGTVPERGTRTDRRRDRRIELP